MNYQNNISSMNFGMAYYTTGSKNFIRALKNKRNVPDLTNINKEMAAAKKAVAETKWADVVSDGNEKGNLVHKVQYKYPNFNSESGRIEIWKSETTSYDSLPEAVNAALKQEASSSELYTTMQETAKLMQETKLGGK